MSTWINFLNFSLDRRGTDDILRSESLIAAITNSDGRECYHSAFDMIEEELKCEEDTGQVDGKGKKIYRYHAQTPETIRRFPRSVAQYSGLHRPAFGYVWFDFDSEDHGHTAYVHARDFVSWLNRDEHFQGGLEVYFSGSKGFHVGVPFYYFGIDPSPRLGQMLRLVAAQIKKQLGFTSLDTTVYNPQRKFRAPGSRHPKTGLFKTKIPHGETKDAPEWLLLEVIREMAKERRADFLPAEINASGKLPLQCLSQLCAPHSDAAQDSISLKEWQRYKRVDGTRALRECLFLSHCNENAAKVTEPEWYAAASIVGRFQDGHKKFQALSKGHPQYSEVETTEKLEQALQASGPRTCKGINALWGKCSACPHFEKIKSPVVITEKDLIATEATGFYFLEADNNGAIKRIPDYGGLLTAYKRDFKYFRDSKTEQTYVWNGTHYVIVSSTDIHAWCEEVMDPKPVQRIRAEFRAKVEANSIKPQSEIDSFFHSTTTGKLNLKNGILEVATGDLLPHDDQIGFRYVLPYEFNPKATCPTFSKFLDDVTLNRRDLKKTLLEFMAYCLWPSYDDHCFLWLSGTGRNGKSTFMEMIQALVGEENTSNVLLNFFEKTNYLEMMNHKLVNISEESDAMRIPPTIVGILKALSSGAKVQVDQKYQLPYSMRATAKLIFASNTPPILSGTEDAIKSRMIVVPFDLKLEEHTDTQTASRIDFGLAEKMKAELPGILNLVLENLRDFARRMPRKVYRSATTQLAMNEIMRDSDPVERWVQDRVRFLDSPTAGPGIAIEDLYEDFRAQNPGSEYLPEMRVFARRMRPKLGAKFFAKQTTIANRKSTFYWGFSVDLQQQF